MDNECGIGTINADLQYNFEEKMREFVKVRSCRYPKVAVVIVHWGLDGEGDLDTENEVQRLAEVFEKRYNFAVCKELLKIKGQQPPLHHQMEKFLVNSKHDHDGDENLLIVYYAGHGLKDALPPGQLRLSGSTTTKSTDMSEFQEDNFEEREAGIPQYSAVSHDLGVNTVVGIDLGMTYSGVFRMSESQAPIRLPRWPTSWSPSSLRGGEKIPNTWRFDRDRDDHALTPPWPKLLLGEGEPEPLEREGRPLAPVVRDDLDLLSEHCASRIDESVEYILGNLCLITEGTEYLDEFQLIPELLISQWQCCTWMRQEASLAVVQNLSASLFKDHFNILVAYGTGTETTILLSSSHWQNDSDEPRFGSVEVRGTRSHFRAHLSGLHLDEGGGEHLRRSGESWESNQHALTRFGIGNRNTLSVYSFTALRQDHKMQEKIVWINDSPHHVSSSAFHKDRSQGPLPPPAKMSPDDDDDDSHFGFYMATDLKRHGRDNGGREYRPACFAEGPGIGRSSICSTQVRADKQSAVEPSTTATWRAAILRTCIHHARIQGTGPCSDPMEPKPEGGHHVIGDTLRIAQLLCV